MSRSKLLPRLRLPSWKRLALLLLVVAPVAAWALVKPVRVLVPGIGGTTCVSETVCVDDLSRADEAKRLYAEAVGFVSDKVAPVHGQPKVVFCSTQACADAYGLGRRSAVTVATVGSVIGPKAWRDYYVRHELIHYVQADRLGALTLFVKPSWFVEGMAYGLSQDPRTPLAEPFEGYRAEFMAWYGAIDKDKLWNEVDKL